MQDKIKQHDYDCREVREFLTSFCGDFCDYRKEATAECVAEDQHFRIIVSTGGYDVCYNCGGKA